MKKPIIIIIIFILLAAVSIGLLWPSFEKLKTVSSKIKETTKDLQDLEEYLSHLKNISSQIQQFSPQLSKIDQALMDDSYLPNIFDFIQKTAAGSGVNLEQIKTGKTATLKDRKNIEEREITLTVSGSYSNFKNFLIAMENNARIIEINNITFSSSRSIRELSRFDLKIKVYSSR